MRPQKGEFLFFFSGQQFLIISLFSVCHNFESHVFSFQLFQQSGVKEIKRRSVIGANEWERLCLCGGAAVTKPWKWLTSSSMICGSSLTGWLPLWSSGISLRWLSCRTDSFPAETANPDTLTQTHTDSHSSRCRDFYSLSWFLSHIDYWCFEAKAVRTAHILNSRVPAGNRKGHANRKILFLCRLNTWHHRIVSQPFPWPVYSWIYLKGCKNILFSVFYPFKVMLIEGSLRFKWSYRLATYRVKELMLFFYF